MKKFSYIFLFVMMLFSSCENKDKIAMQQLFDQVMKVHDEVMPKMDDIHDAKKALKEKLSTADSTLVFSSIKELDNADEAMMVWMQEFNSSYETMPVEEQKKYLNTEMEKINKVKEIMLAAIDNAQKIIDDKVK